MLSLCRPSEQRLSSQQSYGKRQIDELDDGAGSRLSFKYRTLRYSCYLHQGRLCFRCCLSVCLLATLRKNFRTDWHEICRVGWQWADEQMIKFLWRSGSLSGYRDRIVFRIRHYWEIRKAASIDGAARRCSAWHALARIAIASMTSSAHDRRSLVEVCIVSVLLVLVVDNFADDLAV